ncbi:hypothetical protein C8R48DRAFT_672826 [Suillus tomentosus]|nr:hypothetical protein C8R48DRAFT_672826 [Suillus tomentosus]
MSTCLSHSQLFDNSTTRINVLRIANSLGIELLDAYIELIAIDKAHRVYPGDLWEIVGERIIEAKQESILRQHHSRCVGGVKGERHVTVEHLLMEERKKRCQVEVSLYSQALEHLQQHQMSVHHSARTVKRDARPPSRTSRHAVARSPLVCSAVTQDKCEAWLKRRHAFPLPVDAEPLTRDCSILGGSTSSIAGPVTTQEAKRTSVISNCIGSSLPMLGTWVAAGIQETFYDAFHSEQTCQTRLIAHSLTVDGEHTYQRNLGLELLILQAKMRRAQAEVDLYTMAIENAREFDFSAITNQLPSPTGFIPQPQADELCYYEEDRDDVTDDFDDFEFE